MKRAFFALVFALLAADARAANDPSQPACKLQSKQKLSTFVYSAPEKGIELAQLQYFEWSVELLDFPADSLTGRVRMRARRDVPSIRVDAWVSAGAFAYYAQRDLPVVVDHVSIASSARLRLFHPEAAVFDAEPEFPTFEKTRAPIACGDIGLSLPKSSPKAQSGAPREVVLKSSSVPLFDGPTGKVVFTLVPLPKSGPVSLDGFEKSGGFEHVRFDGDVRIDGWVRSSDLRAPNKDDAYGLGGLGMSGTGGGYGSSAKQWSARVDTEIRLGKETNAPVVGILEKGARVWITKGSDWSEIRMVDSAAIPPKGKLFYVRTSDLDP
jgi:hypothetical protein